MMDQAAPTCPKCGQNDQVEKVSTIYLQGIGAKKTAVDRLKTPSPSQYSKDEISRLGKLLAPPMTGKKQMTRPIHPDLMVLVFTGLLPIFLVGIAGSQRGMLLPVFAVVVIFYIFYFWKRRQFIERYHQQKQSLVDETSRTEKAVGRWMKAYYCGRDEVVFRDEENESVPVEQAELLMWKE